MARAQLFQGQIILEMMSSDSAGPYVWTLDFDDYGQDLVGLLSKSYFENNPVLTLRMSDGA